MRCTTTLSPIIFIIRLNDIKLLKLKSQIICYADDTVSICIGNSWNEVLTNIKDDLKSIDHWLSKNSLVLNFNKSVILLHALAEHTLPIIDHQSVMQKFTKTIVQ